MEGVSQDFNILAEHHAEFRLPVELGRTISKRALAELSQVFYDKDGELLSECTVIKNIQIFAARIKAVAPQLLNNPDWKSKGPATDDEYGRSQRTLHKSMQSLFSTSIVRMDYSRIDSSVIKNDLSNIVIDPTKITSTMLKNLGLEDFIPPKGMRRELRTGHMAEAIPEIKRIIGHIKPFSLPGEDSRTQKRGFRLYTTPEGFVVGIQGVNGRKVLYKTDIHGASRRIDHIHDGQRNEIGILRQIQFTIFDVANRVRSDWPTAKEELPGIQAKMLECIDSLKFVENVHKRKLRELVEECLTFKTMHNVRGQDRKQERYNPGSRLAKLVTIPTYVGKRVLEIERIDGYLQEDGIRIDSCIKGQQIPVERFFQRVEKQHQRVLLLNGADLPEAIANETISNIEKMRKSIEPSYNTGNGGICLQPYKSYAHAICNHLGETTKELRLGDRQKAKEEFMKAYVISKLQHCFVDLQGFYKSSLAPDGIPFFRGAIAHLRRIRNELLQKRVAPDVQVHDFNSFVNPVIKLVNNLIDAALPASKKGADKDQRKDVKNKMRALFNEFDFKMNE